MDAKELRLGNWVTDFESKEVQLDIDHFYWQLEAGGVIDQMKPIPLTEDWLRKLGFYPGIDWDHGCFIKDGFIFEKGFLYKQGGMSGTRLFTQCIEIYYVHQLQNLYFALTNTE